MPIFETDRPSFFILSDFQAGPDVSQDLTIARGVHTSTAPSFIAHDVPIAAAEHRRGRADVPSPAGEPYTSSATSTPEDPEGEARTPSGGGGDDGTKLPPPQAGGEMPADDEPPAARLAAPDITTWEVIQKARARQILTAVHEVTQPHLGPEGFTQNDDTGLFVPAQWEDVYACLQAAEPHAGEIFKDLGSGDGRWVLAAAGALGLQAYGYELNPDQHELAKQALQTLAKGRILSPQDQARVHLVQDDLFNADISDAHVIAHYAGGYPPSLNIEAKIEEKLAREGRDGARVIRYGDGLDEHPVTMLELVMREVPRTIIPTAIYRIRKS